MDSIKKTEETGLKIESLFKRVFGHNAPKVKVLKKNNKGNYYINDNFVYAFGTDGTNNPYTNDTWLEPHTIWITRMDVKFNASYISFVNNKVNFQGNWESGRFKGNRFSGSKSVFGEHGIFEGNSYEAPNENFKANPVNFISGAWLDYKNGILGKLHYAKPVEALQYVEVIAVPIGWVIKIVGNDGAKELNIKVLKKIDDKSTDFIFQVVDDGKKYEVDWSDIRIDYRNMGFIKQGAELSLIDGYGINRIDKISLIKSDEDVRVQSKTVIDFTADPKLASIFPKNVEVVLNANEDITKANNIQTKIKNGTLAYEIAIVTDLIQKGIIDGYIDDSWYYLKPVFNNMKGSEEKIQSVKKNQKIVSALSNLNSMLELLSFNSKVLKEAVSAYNTIVKNLQKTLKVNKYIKPQSGDADGKEQSVSMIDFSKDANLSKFFVYGTMPMKFQVKVQSEETKKRALELQMAINDGSLYRDLLQIKHYIAEGYIDGYPDDQHTYLRPLFNGIKATKTVVDKELSQMLINLNKMISLLSFNTELLTEQVNAISNMLVDILKKFFEIDRYIQKNKGVDNAGQEKIGGDSGEAKARMVKDVEKLK